MSGAAAARRRGADSSAVGRLWAALAQRWQGLQERERRLLAFAGLLLGSAALWFFAVQPPLKLLGQAPARLEALEAQLLTMRRLAAETRELRAAPQVSEAQSIAALRTASARLEPSARLAIQGDRAVLTLDGVSGESLRAWLAEVRSGARARPVEAQLARGPKGFSGTISVAIGGRP